MVQEKLFVKGELEKVYRDLNVAYEYCPYSMLKENKRFIRIIQLLFEINEKSCLLKKLVRGIIQSYNKWIKVF